MKDTWVPNGSGVATPLDLMDGFSIELQVPD